MSTRPLKILQVNAMKHTGGAAHIAWTLHQAYRSRGQTAWMAVGDNGDPDLGIEKIPATLPASVPGRQLFRAAEFAKDHNWHIGHHQISGWLKNMAEPARYLKYYRGQEDFDYPGTWQLLDLFPELPDIVHLHNLHVNYFDLRYLPDLSRRMPVVITLHDTWLLSGHCAYALDCERWKIGCGHCPYLGLYPATPHDSTAFNWERKRDIYARSRLYVAAPSGWILDHVSDSILKAAVVKGKVIHNGVDFSIFKPGNRLRARQQLDIPPDAFVLSFVVSRIESSPFKDFATIDRAVGELEQKMKGKKIIFLAVGAESLKQGKEYGEVQIRFMPFTDDPNMIASYYQASDVYLHAAHADTFPNVILEALACGTPVVATAVGGIPEQIADGQTGFLTAPHDSAMMADKTFQLLIDQELRNNFSLNAITYAQQHFGLDRMVDEYLDFYQDALSNWN